jgi:hypothetical protein
MSKSNDAKIDPERRALSLHVQDAALEPVLTTFKQHVDNTSFLRIAPHILLSYGYEKVAWFDFFAERAKIDQIKTHYSGFDEWFQQVEEKVKETAEKEETQKEFRHHLWETAKSHLSELTKDEKVREALRLIRHMALLSSWTSFECVACDSWEAAVNVRPLVLGHPAFVNLPQDTEGITGLETKSVSVGLLARYGFDIRGKLGTLLKQRFDFTGVSGIRKAYTAAFGDKLPLDSILGNENLSRLEAVRHAIVHRAGIADELYLKRTNSTIALGTPIEVDDEMEEAFLNASFDAGCSLLEHIDKYLVANKEQAPVEH